MLPARFEPETLAPGARRYTCSTQLFTTLNRPTFYQELMSRPKGSEGASACCTAVHSMF